MAALVLCVGKIMSRRGDDLRRRCTPRLVVRGLSNLGLHLGVVHDRCTSGEHWDSWRSGGIIPFWTFRTPALISYKLRLAAAAFKLERSMPDRGRRSAMGWRVLGKLS
jgi:hypothetical protein